MNNFLLNWVIVFNNGVNNKSPKYETTNQFEFEIKKKCSCKAQEHFSVFLRCFLCFGEQRIFAEDRPDQVQNPADKAAGEDPKDTEDQSDGVFVSNTFDDAVNSPNDVETGQCENDFQNLRQFVEGSDQIFHERIPP